MVPITAVPTAAPPLPLPASDKASAGVPVFRVEEDRRKPAGCTPPNSTCSGGKAVSSRASRSGSRGPGSCRRPGPSGSRTEQHRIYLPMEQEFSTTAARASGGGPTNPPNLKGSPLWWVEAGTGSGPEAFLPDPAQQSLPRNGLRWQMRGLPAPGEGRSCSGPGGGF